MSRQIIDLFEKHKFPVGRMISSHKSGPEGHFCVFNANVVSPTSGKIWYGDLNLTKEGERLKKVAKELGETLYVLREFDCRFEAENAPISKLISKAVWSTDREIIYEN